MPKLFTGKIYTSFKPLRRVEALITVFGRVVFAGDVYRAERICVELGGCEHIDLDSVAIPGFIDVHIHLDGVGLALNSLDLRDIRSIEELKKRLRDFAKDRTGWILGRGWDQEKFVEKRWPTRWDLDEVVPDKPVLLTRICGHAGVVNSKVIEMLRLEEVFKDNPNLVREKGVATGIVREEVLAYVKKHIEFSYDEKKRFLIDAQKHVLSYGVTSVGFVSVPLNYIPLLIELENRGELAVRTHIYTDAESMDPLKTLGIRKGFGSENLVFMGIKLFVDGSLGARTALLSKPYSDDPSTCGVQMMDVDTLTKVLNDAKRLGIDVAIHAIGDRALDIVLEAVERTGSSTIVRVEHASVVRDDQLDRLANLGLRIAVQPHFIITDFWVVDRVGIDRARWVYRFNSMYARGLVIGFSTDAPVEPVNPWETIYAAVTRGEYEGIELAKHTPHEKLDVVTALHLYTKGSAKVLGRNDIGCLEPGCLADIVVVDRDPLGLEPKQLRTITTRRVFVGAEQVA